MEDKYLVLVNKDHKYVDDNLFKTKKISVNMPDKGEDAFIEEETLKAYELLKKRLKKEKIPCSINSAGRTLKAQEKTVEEMRALHGDEFVEKYVSAPGHSEHHTGLALDLCLKTPLESKIEGLLRKLPKDKAKIFTDKISARYKKLSEICNEYGFVVRYTADKQAITQVNPERWHIRYVGVENAKRMTNENLCLEEYVKELSKLNNSSVGL